MRLFIEPIQSLNLLVYRIPDTPAPRPSDGMAAIKLNCSLLLRGGVNSASSRGGRTGSSSSRARSSSSRTGGSRRCVSGSNGCIFSNFNHCRSRGRSSNGCRGYFFFATGSKSGSSNNNRQNE